MFLVAAILGLLTISSFTQAQVKEPFLPPPEKMFTLEQLAELCYKGADQGHTCDSAEPQIRYHYNFTTNKCLSFLYKGCGGNINNHETLYGCEALCKKWDVPYGCVDRKNPTGICNIEGVTCPEGNICKYDRYGDGVCCDKETEEQYRKERKPECDEGKVLIKHQTSLGWVPLLGTKCSYEFCPEGADCVEGKWFAHCCGSEEKFGPKKA